MLIKIVKKVDCNVLYPEIVVAEGVSIFLHIKLGGKRHNNFLTKENHFIAPAKKSNSSLIQHWKKCTTS
jgi:hypothetical protein